VAVAFPLRCSAGDGIATDAHSCRAPAHRRLCAVHCRIPPDRCVIGPLAVCAGSATVEVLQRRPLVRVAFNAAQYLISTTAAATVYELLVARLGADWHVALLDIRGTPLLGASISVYFLLNSRLVAGVIALSRGLSFWQVWRQAQQDIRVQYLAMVALGILMAMLWPRAPWT